MSQSYRICDTRHVLFKRFTNSLFYKKPLIYSFEVKIIVAKWSETTVFEQIIVM